MTTSDSAFIGIHFSSGRKPLTLAVLGADLNLIQLANSELNNLGALLSDLESAILCISTRSSPKSVRFADAYSVLHEHLANMSFRPYSAKNDARQWFKTDANDSFKALLQEKLFSQRTLEGRIQRALILYEQGLQISDPMEFFEEITRYKLLHGILPLENIYSTKQLDALVAGYLAWMTVHRSQQIIVKGELILPAPE